MQKEIPGAKGYSAANLWRMCNFYLIYRDSEKLAPLVREITYFVRGTSGGLLIDTDHIGLISELTKLGIKLLLLDTQYNYVHFADDIFKRERYLCYEPIDEKNIAIITYNESRDFLANMGIAGEIISTTSHSKDSISIILDNGECMAGDLEPMEYLDAYDKNMAL